MPVVITKGKGSKVWDVEGKEYLDFLSAYSAVNPGHCHPRLVSVLCSQAEKLTLSSRAFYNDKFPSLAQKITTMFGYDMVLPMNTGAEAVETAMKLSRKWAYLKKGVPENEAIILCPQNNFHGRTIGVISMSTDPSCRNGFGPFLPRVGSSPFADVSIRYGNTQDLKGALEKYGPNVAAFLVEPIQGEAGIVFPPEDYLKNVQDLCRQHNVLFLADEVQTGLARTGKLLASSHTKGVRPDIVILGKALSGGMYPVSAVLADKDIMLCISPGEHGSTYGGNPLGAAIAIEALNVIEEEALCEKSLESGKYFLQLLSEATKGNEMVKEVRGKGLLAALEVNADYLSATKKTAWHLCLLMKKNGLLAKPTHENIVRLAPPLVISRKELETATEIIKRSIEELDALKDPESIPDSDL